MSASEGRQAKVGKQRSASKGRQGKFGKESSARKGRQQIVVYELTGFGVGASAVEAYFKRQAVEPLSRHHALHHARALREAHEAATRVADGTSHKPTALEGFEIQRIRDINRMVLPKPMKSP